MYSSVLVQVTIEAGQITGMFPYNVDYMLNFSFWKTNSASFQMGCMKQKHAFEHAQIALIQINLHVQCIIRAIALQSHIL